MTANGPPSVPGSKRPAPVVNQAATSFVSILVRAYLLGLAALALASSARADAVVPPPQTLWLQSVRAVEGDAPAVDRDAAIASVRARFDAAQAQLGRCVRDGGGLPDWGGRVRARVRWERSELPVRTRIVEATVRGAARRCVQEILPNLLLRPAPRGTLTLEVVLVPGVGP